MLAFILFLAIGIGSDQPTLERDLRAQPANAAGQLELAQSFEKKGLRAPAFVAYLRFLSLRPEGKEAQGVAAHLREMLSAAVAETDGGGDEREMMLRMAAASAKLPENRKANEFEKLQRQVALALSMFNDAPATEDFTSQVNLPFFADIGRKELTDAFVAIALSSLKLKGTDVWMSHHPADVEKAWEIIRSQRK